MMSPEARRRAFVERAPEPIPAAALYGQLGQWAREMDLPLPVTHLLEIFLVAPAGTGGATGDAAVMTHPGVGPPDSIGVRVGDWNTGTVWLRQANRHLRVLRTPRVAA